MSVSNEKIEKLNQCINRLKTRDDDYSKQLLGIANSFLSRNDIDESKYDSLFDLIEEISKETPEEISPKIEVSTTEIPISAIKLIQEFEGLADVKSQPPKIKAYPDPNSGGEPYTIGWGTTFYPDGKKVRPGDLITKQEADQYFVDNLEKYYWNRIKSTIPNWDEMNDDMRSALCSFAYNLGAEFYGKTNFKTITNCLSDLNKWDSVPQAMLLYVNPGSPVEAGLRRRRGAEGELWLKGLSQKRSGKTDTSVEKTIIRAKQYTFLKKENKQSDQLKENELKSVISGKFYEVDEVISKQDNSWKVKLSYNAGIWWIYTDHWDINVKENEKNNLPQRKFNEKNKILNVPYLSQNDNVIDPYETCNVTCVAMCLRFYGVKGDGSGQLEDQLMKIVRQKGWNRGNPLHLKELIQSFPGVNLEDNFTKNGTFDLIRQSINNDQPVFIHGYFTPVGHIIVIKGYDDTGFIVNDPHGEYFSWGYDRSKSGDGLHYSYSLIAKLCSPESITNPKNIWIHSVKKN